MNKRIKELMIQGWVHANGPDQGIVDNDGLTIRSALQEDMEPIFQKFAELIVRECIEHLEGTVLVPNIEHSRTKTKCIRSIKEHFGVEE